LTSLLVKCFGDQRALSFLQFTDSVFHRILHEYTVHVNCTLLPNPVSTVDGLIFNVWIPERI